MSVMAETINEFIKSMGILNMHPYSLIMIGVAFLFLFLAIKKGFEPLLLVPIAFGMLLSNLPLTGIFDIGYFGEDSAWHDRGLLYHFYAFNKYGIFPILSETVFQLFSIGKGMQK